VGWLLGKGTEGETDDSSEGLTEGCRDGSEEADIEGFDVMLIEGGREGTEESNDVPDRKSTHFEESLRSLKR
jgi:hypothetical protein